MRESIICTGRVASREYVFPETGVGITSYEELCYYLREHMSCYVKTLPDNDLAAFIANELGLVKLGKQLAKLNNPQTDQMKYFSALFREGSYYNENDIKEILDEYRDLKEAPEYEQCKCLGDISLTHGRAAMAIHYYMEALKEDIKDEVRLAAIYHNLGVAKARLFRYSAAKVDFLRAYQHGGEEASLFGYYTLVAFEKGVEAANAELADLDTQAIYQERFETRYADILEDFTYTEEAERLKRVDFLVNAGRPEEADRISQQFIRKQQIAMRRSLYEEDGVETRNLPDTYVTRF